MRFRVRATAATAAGLAVCLVLLPGCGGGGKKTKKVAPTTTRYPPTVPVSNVNLTEGSGVCGVITQAEVRTATGLAAQPGTGSRGATNEACRWNLPGNNQFVLAILTGGGAGVFDRARGQTAGAEDIAGVGEKAYVSNDTASMLKGDKVVLIQVVTTQAANLRKQAAVALIKNAAPRA